jgi:hypothetical protein
MSSDSFLDGNTAAGELLEIFSVEVTTAVGQCAGCGRTSRLAETRLYIDAPGLVLRCATCEQVLMRLVKAPDRTWIDMRGLAHLEILTATRTAQPNL